MPARKVPAKQAVKQAATKVATQAAKPVVKPAIKSPTKLPMKLPAKPSPLAKPAAVKPAKKAAVAVPVAAKVAPVAAVAVPVVMAPAGQRANAQQAGSRLATAKKVAAKTTAAELPVTQQSAAKQAVAKPATVSPASRPAAGKTAVTKPTIAASAMAKKAAVKSAPVVPAAAKTKAAPQQPAANKPAIAAPAVAKKAAFKPVPLTPATVKPAAVLPPTAKQAAAAKLGVETVAAKKAVAQSAPKAMLPAKVTTLADAAPRQAVPAPAQAPAPASASASASAPASSPRARQRGAPRDTASDVLAVLTAAPAAAPVAAPEPALAAAPKAAPAPAPTDAPTPAPRPSPTGPAHSQIVLQGDDSRVIAWLPGHACPATLQKAAQHMLDGQGHIAADNDAALPTLLRLASEAGHLLRVDEAVWPHLATNRDARSRLQALEAAYPDGPGSAALQQVLSSPLPAYQAEGALFAVIAGRALIADERGLGKGVQAMAAAELWRRHFGVKRVLVLCAPAQRAAWQRAWQRFAPDALPGAPGALQVMDGGLHQRQALWSTDVGVRVLSPDTLASDAAHIAFWAPDLIIVDEPQHLGLRDDAWAQLQSPHALVLSGAPLADEPVLMRAIVAWLDQNRQGPLAALLELQAAADVGRNLTASDIERLTDDLSRLMLQRQRTDLLDQLPPLVFTERLFLMAPGQRELHDAHLAQARRLVAGWQRSGYFSDADQWRLGVLLRDMQWACHRADPTQANSPLAQSCVQALATQLTEWATTGPMKVALLCATQADRDQLGQRLADWAGPVLDLHFLLPTDALPGGLDAVLQVGVPWRTRRSPAGPRGEAPAGQQQVYAVALGGIDSGLFDTLIQRQDPPRGLADGGGRAYLQGERLQDWLQLVAAALPAA